MNKLIIISLILLNYIYKAQYCHCDGDYHFDLQQGKCLKLK